MAKKPKVCKACKKEMTAEDMKLWAYAYTQLFFARFNCINCLKGIKKEAK
jgi:hypothetical protein